jgi:hypothetical protein
MIDLTPRSHALALTLVGSDENLEEVHDITLRYFHISPFERERYNIDKQSLVERPGQPMEVEETLDQEEEEEEQQQLEQAEEQETELVNEPDLEVPVNGEEKGIGEEDEDEAEHILEQQQQNEVDQEMTSPRQTEELVHETNERGGGGESDNE